MKVHPKVRIGLIAVVGLVWIFQEYQAGTLFNYQREPSQPALRAEVAYDRQSDNQALEEAITARISDRVLEGSGVVKAVLADDNQGTRHQKFILSLPSGRTVLIAHNIDLAPRLPNLQKGDSVGFKGEYEWNDKGGVVHWTHHDPAGRHEAGWLDYNGQRYQ